MVHEKDERVQLAIDTEDPDLVIDLRELNRGRPSDTFDVFFRELERQVEQFVAADERRHGIAHMSEYLSIRDLRERVSKNLPEGTPIPSESTIIHSFAPPNMYAKSSQYYTGKINLRFTIQRRQLCAYHSDAHWCNALFRYLRELAIQDQDNCVFLSCDDKSKVDFGEPGYSLSSGVCGKKSIAPTTSALASLDHDVVQKGSIIPSVDMICTVPETIDDGFYRGVVNIKLKEGAFQPSSTIRSTLELIQTLRENGFDSLSTPNIYMVTDGGPEHRLTFESVKISLMLLFKELDLDFMVAIRTAPGHSYRNIVERIMSIANIGLQNVALERLPCHSDPEIKKCRNIGELRNKPNIKDDWQKSISPLIETLSSRFSRLKLKDSPFKVLPAATDSELEEFIAKSAVIDPSIPSMMRSGHLQKKNLISLDEYQRFKSNHCHEGVYAFQIRKCDDLECCGAKS